MRILFKIIAVPFVAVLSVLWAILVFVFGVIGGILQYVCGFAALLSIVFFIGGFTPSGIFCAVVAFLISPVGLPLVADFLVDAVGGINSALVNFIMA
ncbi:hypothetical protein FACS189492_2930 [Clostridia bacterium]|nr:hypothetical protein FACS189492_2930 [Clostridia bacterium]